MPLKSQRRYFIIVPLFSAFIWFSTLLAMLLTWLISGRPKYVASEIEVPYISDIGASFLKPLFIVACCITGLGLFISLTLERLLRHQGRLPAEHRRRERVCGRFAIVGAFIAMCALALLSGFDLKRHRMKHFIFLLMFMIGVGLSAIFTVVEFRWLAHDYPEVDKLRRAYVAKAVVGLTLVGLSAVFAVTFFTAPNVGGVVEWTIGFGFTLYLLTFVYDFRMVEAAPQEAGSDSEVQIFLGLDSRY